MIKLINAQGLEKILPETILLRDVPLGFNVPYYAIYGLDGAVKTGKTTVAPRQFSLNGRIYYPDKERIRQETDALLAFLAMGPIDVHRYGRFLQAYPLGAPHSWIDEGAEVELRLPMIAFDPFWYGPEKTVTVTGTETITVEGNVIVKPFVRSAESVGSLHLTNLSTGKEIVVSNANGIVEVDNKDFVVWVNGAENLDPVAREWITRGFELVPGENEIQTNVPIEMKYRPAWH